MLMSDQKMSPRIVNYGVDTLILNVHYVDEQGRSFKCEPDDVLVGQLNEWKLLAQGVHDDYPTAWEFNRRVLHMCPNGTGRGQWPWMLKTRDITLYISTGHWNSIASVRLSSEYLWSCGDVLAAVRPLHTFLRGIFCNDLFLQVSLVDPCVDVVGWSDVEKLDRERDFVSHARKGRSRAAREEDESEWADSFGDGLTVTGYDFGRSAKRVGHLSCRIYNKSRELAKSGKDWFRDLWRARGYSEADGDVWRVEFSFKRGALHELLQEGVFHGIEDVYELPAMLPVLWAYAAGHVAGDADGLPDGWLRCVITTNDTNRRRWPVHPAWKVVQGAFLNGTSAVPGQFGEIVRRRWREGSIEKGVAEVMGFLSSLAAWAGDDLADEGVDLSLVLHWLMEQGTAYLKRTKRDFAEEVKRKRIKFGEEALSTRLLVSDVQEMAGD
jgi:hypothetical protein